jgi:hypothetical protein
MLPPFIIEEIRKRERDERARHEESQPRLELPIPGRRDPSPPSTKNNDESERGVVVIDL